MPYMPINNIQLHYEIHGQGEPLLFIHGLGGSLRDWDAQVEHFAQRYKVITVDVRGHGDSGKPNGPYSMAQFAGDIVALLNALDIDDMHVCGISMGGMIAFQMAADHPARIRSLTIVNSGPSMVPTGIKMRWMLWQRALLINLFSMRRLAEAVGARLLPQPERAEARRAFIDRLGSNRKRHYRASFRAIVGWSVLDKLPEMTMPALILTGDLDYSTPAQKQPYVALMPNARMVVIDDARHNLPMEWPERFNAALEAFLAGVDSTSSPMGQVASQQQG